MGTGGKPKEQLGGAAKGWALFYRRNIPFDCDPATPAVVTLGYIMTNISHCTALTAEEVLASKAVTVVSAALCLYRIFSWQHRKRQPHLGPSRGATGTNPEAP